MDRLLLDPNKDTGENLGALYEQFDLLRVVVLDFHNKHEKDQRTISGDISSIKYSIENINDKMKAAPLVSKMQVKHEIDVCEKSKRARLTVFTILFIILFLLYGFTLSKVFELSYELGVQHGEIHSIGGQHGRGEQGGDSSHNEEYSNKVQRFRTDVRSSDENT